MLSNHEATTVAKVLVEQLFSLFSVPPELHSDQGRKFKSEMFRECSKLLGVKKTRTTHHAPRVMDWWSGLTELMKELTICCQ